MSGGGGNTNTVQSSTPWSGVQPGLEALYGNATSMLGSPGSGPQAYSGQTTAPLNATQNEALYNLTNIGQGGYGTLSAAQQQGLGTTQGIVAGTDPLSQSLMAGATGQSNPEQYLQSTLGSNFLNVQNNPALNNAMNAANYNTNFNYTNDVMPALNSQYSAAGRFGSGAMGTATNQANNTLASQISNTNAGMSLADLQQLQGIQSQNAGTLGSLENANAGLLNNRQGSALQLLPGMATQGVGNAEAELSAGNQQQAQAQTSLQNLISQYNTQQMQPYTNMGLLSGLLSGAPWGTVSNGSTSNVANPYSTALGAGTLGLGLYNSGALSGLMGAGAGATGGALFSAGGAGLTGAALDASLAGTASAGVGAGVSGAGAAALMGLAA